MKESSPTRILFLTARGLSWVAGVFCAIVLAVLVISVVQSSTSMPQDITGIQELKERLQASSEDAALLEQVRALDQLARKAYFTSRSFARAGAWLLLIGSVVWVSSLRTVYALTPRVPQPAGDGDAVPPAREDAAARRGLLALGASVFVVAVVLVVITGRPPPAATDQAGTAPAEPTEDPALQWPNFRGPGGLAVAAVQDVPMAWDAESGENIRWKTAVPLGGFNSPVVWGNRVFLTGADTNTLEIYAFDTDSGDLVWTHPCDEVAGSPAEWPEVMEETGYAAPGLVTDGRRVIALFGTGDLVACDLEGRRLWARNVGVPDNHYGHSSSLIQQGELVYLQYDQNDVARLMAIRARDGSTAWQQVREVAPSWASPVLIEHEGVSSLVLSADPLVVAYDPVSGVPRWSLDCMGGEIAPSPAYGAGKIFAVNEYPVLAAINPADGSLVWEYEDDLPEVPSPVATDQRVYIVPSVGPLTCLDAATGEVRWIHELESDIYGSPVAAAGRIYLMDREGTTHIFQDSDELEILGTSSIHEPSTCTPAMVGGRIYIRGTEHLFCIEAKAGEGGA